MFNETSFTTGPMIQFYFNHNNCEYGLAIGLLSRTGTDSNNQWHYPFKGLGNTNNLEGEQTVHVVGTTTFRLY